LSVKPDGLAGQKTMAAFSAVIEVPKTPA